MLSDEIIKHVFEVLELDTEEKRWRFKEMVDLAESRRGLARPEASRSSITTKTEEDIEDA